MRLARLPNGSALFACTDVTGVDDGTSPQTSDLEARGPSPQPNKQACTDPEDPNCLPGSNDPYPNAPGKYIDIAGSPMTPTWCATNGNDTDHDLIDDYCEQKLAWHFRPLLRGSTLDGGLGGEPYYLVQRVASTNYLNGYDPANDPYFDEDPIRIMYLLAYYYDYGSGCPLPPFPCDFGHFGDSEFILIDVTYKPNTKHSLLQQALGSAHWGAETSASVWRPPYELEYPSADGSRDRYFPRFWVSKNKHANYPSRTSCDSGAYGEDDCPLNWVDWRPAVSGMVNNIGSSTFPRPDIPYGSEGNLWTCVQSSDSQKRLYEGYTKKECFWSPLVGEDFSGWRPEVGTTRYRTLIDFYFTSIYE